jgi:replicative DNA helicase
MLTPSDFYDPEHGKLYGAMLALETADKPINTITLPDTCVGLIRELEAQVVPQPSQIVHYAQMVVDAARLRNFIRVGTAAVGGAYEPTADAATYLEDSLARMFEACHDSKDTHAFSPIREVMPTVIAQIEAAYEGNRATGITTGWWEFDATLGGFEPGDLVYVAARPSMGKTAFAVDMARRFAVQGKSVAFFSLEMGINQIGGRLLCCEGGLNYSKARLGLLSPQDLPNVMKAAAKLEKLQIYIDDGAASSPLSLRSRCRTLTHTLKGQPLGAIFVDYVQLMSPDNRGASENEALTSISKALKNLAKEMGCPLIALSQLNRDCERREDKHPIMADLRASGSLEQDADVVLLLYRDDYYNPNSNKRGITEIKIGKQRNGPAGVTVELAFSAASMSFHNPADLAA